MNDDELKAAIAARPFEKVTEDYIKSRIKDTVYQRLGTTLTHCAIHLDNGFIVTGESACVDERNYNQEIGENIAQRNAFAKLWSLFGFLLAEKRLLQKGAV